MRLLLYLGDDLVDAAILDVDKISVPGYLGNIKREFEKKYAFLVAMANAKPEFFVVNANSLPGKDRVRKA